MANIKEPTPLEKLDKVLELLCHPNNKRTIGEIGHGLGGYGIFIKEEEISRIILKLNDDGYLNHNKLPKDGMPINSHLFTSFDGEVFNQKGGYSKQYNDELAKQSQSKNADKIAMRNSNITARASVVAAITGIFLIIWEIVKYFKAF